MILQSLSKRRTTPLWQFSIAQLLVATFLAACVLAAFRWDPLAGIVGVYFLIALATIFLRTRIAIRQQEPDWVDLTDERVSEHSVLLGIWSTMIVLPAMALCFFGIAFVLYIGAIVIDACRDGRPFDHLHLDRVVAGFIFLGFAPVTLGTFWLWFTWPTTRVGRDFLPLGENRLK